MSSPNETQARLGMLAGRIAETLTQEVLALSGVRDALAAMLDAIRGGVPEAMTQSAESLQEFAHLAAERRTAHTRQKELFFRVAGTQGDSIAEVLLLLQPYPDAQQARSAISSARTTIREIAAESGQLVAAADYALRAAGHINHELILMLHGLMQPDGGRVYTSKGDTTAPKNRRSMLDRTG
jgi:hypothetical protein